MNPEKINLEINGYYLQLSIFYSKRKSLHLALKPAGVLHARAPAGMPEEKIIDFIQKRSGWITGHMDKQKNAEKAGVGTGLAEGRTLFFLGKPRKLIRAGSKISVDEECIYIPDRFILDDLEEWYRQQSTKLVVDFIERNKAKLPPCEFKIRKQKRIWGSCNSKGSININSRIAMCRPSAVEYVLWHEICHLKHLDHSRKFYNCLQKVFPEYAKERKWLRDNAALLLI